MATSIKLKSDIKKIEAAIKSKATPKSLVSKLETQLDKLKSDLASLSSAKPKKGVTKTKVLSSLQKLKAKVKSTKSLSGYKKSGIDIEKDADVPALPLGKRFAKTTGNPYYEYRLNRADVKQPPKRYPKLADGGMMARGGEISINGKSIKIKYVKRCCPSIKNDGTVGSYQYDFVDEQGNPYIGYGNSKNEALKSIEDYQNNYASGGYMAKGGLVKHGLMLGDEITDSFMDNIQVYNKIAKKDFIVNLDKGERKELESEFSSGGRTLSAINRDRAYKSDEAWEQNYTRKSRPKNPKYQSSSDFFEEGGEMHRLFEDGEA